MNYNKNELLACFFDEDGCILALSGGVGVREGRYGALFARVPPHLVFG